MMKEKLAGRLRQRGENLGMMTVTDREMMDTELLSYKEDLENQDCLLQMEDLQVECLLFSVANARFWDSGNDKYYYNKYNNLIIISLGWVYY